MKNGENSFDNNNSGVVCIVRIMCFVYCHKTVHVRWYDIFLLLGCVHKYKSIVSPRRIFCIVQTFLFHKSTCFGNLKNILNDKLDLKYPSNSFADHFAFVFMQLCIRNHAKSKWKRLDNTHIQTRKKKSSVGKCVFSKNLCVLYNKMHAWFRSMLEIY